MKIGPSGAAASQICGANPDTIIVRGHDLVADLMGRITFTDHIWLLIAGALPSAAQRRVLDATLVAIAEHGLVPSVQAARMTLAAAPEALQGAVAAGLLGCGSVILGASEAAGRLLDEVLREAGTTDDLETAAKKIVGGYRAVKKAIPGYGHPLHKSGDPRAVRLLALAAEVGLAGRHVAAARAVERVLPEVVGRPLVMNISCAIPCALLDAGYPLLALRGVPLLARAASLVGHLLEEQQAPIGFRMSEAGAAAIRYAGPAPDGFVPSEG